MEYSIKDFSKIFNVSEHTIRYYTDIGLLPCKRTKNNHRIFDEESINWMQGILCLKGCGATIDDIKEYCRLCLLEESKENLIARYKIILKQREQAYKKVEDAKATAKYMDEKVAHYKSIINGQVPDDTNPNNWSSDTRPKQHPNRVNLLKEELT